jgi:imidazolonepropionase-like amidohydrolase
VAEHDQQPLVIRGGALIDGLGGPPVAPGTVIVEGGRVAWAGPGSHAPASPSGARVIEAGGKTVLPGLIDAHSHLMYMGYASAVEIDAKHSIERATIHAVKNAETTLLAGYTTVRDVGCRGTIAVSVRDAIAADAIPGPRILAAGRIISTTGGLADFLPPWLRNSHPMGLIADGTAEIRKAVRQLVKEGVDVIKLEGSGHAISRAGGTAMSTMSEAEMTAAVQEARKYGKRVAVHAQSTEAIKNALRADVDTLEHGCFMDDEGLELLKAGDTIYVPTISNLYSYTEQGPKIGVSPTIVAEVAATEESWVRSLKRAHEAGVRIAAGGDVGNRYPQGQNAVELEMMVRHGFSPLEAIEAATRVAAEAVDVADDTGTLVAGKAADIIIVDGDPLSDIRILRDASRITLVVRSGRVYQEAPG